MIDNIVNRNLRRILVEKDMKHREVADRIGVSEQTFSHMVTGRRKIYADEVIPLALALNVPMEELFRMPAAE